MWSYKKLRIPIHLLFWILVLGFYTLLFGNENRDYAGAFRFVITLLPITMATTYFLNYFLVPRYLLVKKYFRFILYFIYTIIISITLELNIVIFTLVKISDFGMEKMSPASFNIFYLIAANYLVVFLAVSLKLLNHWYQIQNENLLLEKEGMEIELKLKEAELKLLKAQIHPHFLFNTLNNLYGLALAGSEKTPDTVLKISSLLDFMLYRSTQPRVQLTEEIDYIKDYIELEKLRYHRIRIKWREKGVRNDLYIAPMLLQPFIENAFKHGTSHDIERPWLEVKLSVNDESELSFSVENSRSPESNQDPGGYTEGIGLKNVQKRLKILYADHYQLEIKEETEKFKILLKLVLNYLKT
jgi:sensor histidine kinase YesM